jgi:hypothetical protein
MALFALPPHCDKDARLKWIVNIKLITIQVDYGFRYSIDLQRGNEARDCDKAIV